jgi:hypothetical protein
MALLVHPLVGRSAAAQVFQVQGGGSSLFAGYGGVVNVWGNGYDGSLGIGYLDGLRIGATARRLIGGRDTLRVGNDILPLSLPTDIFGGGSAMLAQGVSLQRRRGRTTLHAFGGASANALAAPYFAANRASHGMGYAHATYDVSRTLSFGAHAVITTRQSLLASATWRPALNVVATAAGGVGSNSPFASTAIDAKSEKLDVRAAFSLLGTRFRRAEAPLPLQSENERENVLLTWRPRLGLTFTAGRQHFRQDSSFRTLAQRATLTQFGVNATPFKTSLSSGIFLSQSGAQRNISSFVSARSPMAGRFQSELYLLRVWEPAPSRITTPVLLLRETITQRLSLLQVISRNQGRTTVNFGGTLNTGLSSVSLDYQVVQSPYLTKNPFVQTIGLNARLQLGSYAVSLGSFVTPDGKVHYSAQGSTFLYRGLGGMTARSDNGARLERYMVSGRVVDEAGSGIEGAALEIDGTTVYTDSRGRFFVRRPSSRKASVRVVLDDFLLPGRFSVVSAPTAAIPAREQDVVPLVIVLQRLPSKQ